MRSLQKTRPVTPLILVLAAGVALGVPGYADDPVTGDTIFAGSQ